MTKDDLKEAAKEAFLELMRSELSGRKPPVSDYRDMRTTRAVEVYLRSLGSEASYREIEESLVQGGCEIAKNPNDRHRILTIVVASNPKRFYEVDNRVGLVEWREKVA